MLLQPLSVAVGVVVGQSRAVVFYRQVSIPINKNWKMLITCLHASMQQRERIRRNATSRPYVKLYTAKREKFSRWWQHSQFKKKMKTFTCLLPIRTASWEALHKTRTATQHNNSSSKKSQHPERSILPAVKMTKGFSFSMDTSLAIYTSRKLCESLRFRNC